MQLTSRSATLVVATEQLCGNFGLPTTAPSRISILTLRNEPELRGISGSSELNTPAMTADTVQASLSLKPQSMLSMLSRRSMVIAAFCGVDLDLDLEQDAVGRQRLEQVVPARVDHPGLRHLADAVDHALLGIVQPVAGEGLDGLLAVLGAQLLQPPLGTRAAPMPARKSPYHWPGTRIRLRHMRITSLDHLDSCAGCAPPGRSSEPSSYTSLAPA